MEKLVIIDSYALIHRSYHALPPLVSPEGILVNGVYGFMLVFLKMLNELQPNYIAAAFDLAGPTFRHKEYKEYKAKRVKAPDNFYEQINIVKEILRAFGITILEKEGYEADDIIGTVAKKAQERDWQIIILTGDLDTLQLVNDKVSVYTLRHGLQDAVIYDEKKVKERFSLKPEQLIDYKALKGDPSDNIPGVPSIGEKTSQQLIADFGNLDNLYQGIEKGKEGRFSKRILEKLKDFKDQAYFSRHLVEINTNVEIDFSLDQFKLKPLDKEKIMPLLEKFGFRSLASKLFSRKSTQPDFLPKNFKLRQVKEKENGDLLLEKIKEEKEIGLLLDFEEGKNKVKGLGFSFRDGDNFYLFAEDFSGFFKNSIDWEEKVLITHNAKFLYQTINRFSSCFFEDLEILFWLIDSARKNYSLLSAYNFFFKKEINQSFEELLSGIFSLREVIENKVLALGLKKVWEEIEKPLIPVLAEMEKNGIKIDVGKLGFLQKEIEKELSKLQAEIFELAGGEFNINSPRQLAEVLFNRLQIKSKGIRKTASGKISTDVDELNKIAACHSIIPLIIEYREKEKLKNSFLATLPNFLEGKTQKIHSVFSQTGTTTGRLSSQTPNLQNIPYKGSWGKKIRSIFISEDGFSLLSLDYSQIELRLAAHLSGDLKMKEIFENDEDIHLQTACYVFNLPKEKISPEARKQAKILNFGIIYGMGNRAFAQTAGISLEEAKKFRENYFSQFSGLKNYLDYSLAKAKQLGYAETIFGRKRFLPMLGSFNRLGKEQERAALNMPIQGLAADVIKLAMIKINNFIKSHNLEKEIKILLQVHDELILEVKSGIIEEMAPQLREIMEKALILDVPLKVDIKKGKTWGDWQ